MSASHGLPGPRQKKGPVPPSCTVPTFSYFTSSGLAAWDPILSILGAASPVPGCRCGWVAHVGDEQATQAAYANCRRDDQRLEKDVSVSVDASRVVGAALASRIAWSGSEVVIWIRKVREKRAESHGVPRNLCQLFGGEVPECIFCANPLDSVWSAALITSNSLGANFKHNCVRSA